MRLGSPPDTSLAGKKSTGRCPAHPLQVGMQAPRSRAAPARPQAARRAVVVATRPGDAPWLAEGHGLSPVQPLRSQQHAPLPRPSLISPKPAGWRTSAAPRPRAQPCTCNAGEDSLERVEIEQAARARVASLCLFLKRFLVAGDELPAGDDWGRNGGVSIIILSIDENFVLAETEFGAHFPRSTL